MFASRAVRIVAFFAGTAVAGQALGATPAIVMDADSGKVLYAERATDPWYPASVTKIMTAYVALDLVRQGKARMDQLLTMSESAAANPPSKMGFKPGTQLTLENALKIIMVKSANDVAAMIGESLAGSVEDFSALMNDASQRLGMTESNWVNQHGLPDPRQKTSARDMAILAQAVKREFPEQSALFKIGAIRFGKIVMRNHNGLLGRYPGVDGMKTGFICSSGFNVVTTAEQNGRRLIAVVLGGTTANERNLRAAELLDRGFAVTGGNWGGQTAQQLPASNLIAPTDMRPVVCDRRGPLPAEEDGTAAVSAGNTNDNSNPVLAFAGGAPVPPRTTLGPRVQFEPVRVWLGATPPPTATAEAKDEPEAKPAKPEAKPERKQAAKPAPKPAPKAAPKAAAAKPAPPKEKVASEAFASTSVMDDGKAKPSSVTPADALKPAAKAKPAAKKPVVKKAEAKKPAAKKAPAKKPAGKKTAASDD